MSLIVELENPQEASFIKKILEQIKGIKSVEEIEKDFKEKLSEVLYEDMRNMTPENTLTFEEVKENYMKKKRELFTPKEPTSH